jgi:hypothetical protein
MDKRSGLVSGPPQYNRLIRPGDIPQIGAESRRHV